MNIQFANGKIFNYTQAFGLENDYHKGVKRPSLEIHMSPDVITYTELDEILSNATNLSTIILTGDVPVDMNGNIVDEIPQNIHKGFCIKGKITVDDEEITFKLFSKSNEEMENEMLRIKNAEAVALIDELLIALEV